MIKPIWRNALDLAHANCLSKDCTVSHMGIELTEIGDDYLKGRMPVDERTRQPAGVLHGGASVLLAETLASWAATFCVDTSKSHCVGLEINANHVRPVSEGFVTGTARPLHLGRSTQIWQVCIENEVAKPVCFSRVTIAVVNIPSSYVNRKTEQKQTP